MRCVTNGKLAGVIKQLSAMSYVARIAFVDYTVTENMIRHYYVP